METAYIDVEVPNDIPLQRWLVVNEVTQPGVVPRSPDGRFACPA
jgi:hypothetical protein